ncbi:M42 family peptidase [Spongiactinospora rosea]|uniref:M42 family peptidase n=1 Tax=Spongiactinospora rosea TaxID=2248750 RepID=A0A366M1P7_9ACTN|nr:M20/M25/M40 family metallo-hydrolase [Spongiactinospora rosea]RBQ20105.1 M42 family peptidase [Spongiactinospora rosea]
MTSWDPLGDLSGLIRSLSATPAPAGNEDRLTAAVADHLTARGLTPVVDRLGQVAVTVGGSGDGPRILVSAHLDELGLVVRGIEADGWLRVHRLGGMPERVLPAARLVVHTRDGDIPAIVGVKSHHLTPPEEKYVARPATDLYLDLGANSREEATRLGVRVGDPITYAPTWDELAGGRFAGKSLDDRVGVAALLAYVDRLLADPPPQPVHVAFTTQEEFHVRGTLALVSRFAPDVVVNVDVAPATDTPDLSGVGSVVLGGGPTLSRLSFHGRGTLGGLIPHPGLVRAVEAAGRDGRVPLQHDAMVGIITDAAFVPMATAEGIAAVGVGIPVRYTHAPTETGQLSDVVATTDLLVALTARLRDTDLSRGAAQLRNGGMA